ncbi:hypothetical protein BJB45_08590 [Halomonas huangheensis]|uniref:Uncharacterized protein n=1 Tax=Halomonas huangheensis TaxID=1178482 RepID=W1NBL1_9GAMM|nr:hypothetical protein AR456_18385 [Halomonas huangheensis]ERL52601.1 hypothetical protein BJB45_08590 [Halomonas huangheensis]
MLLDDIPNAKRSIHSRQAFTQASDTTCVLRPGLQDYISSQRRKIPIARMARMRENNKSIQLPDYRCRQIPGCADVAPSASD